MAKAPSVPDFLAALTHARKTEIMDLRTAILASDAGIGEQIKWNAPSFTYGGDDRVTLRLQPRDRVDMVFHRGARATPAPGFSFPDPTGRIVWAAPDRGVVAIADRADLDASLPAIVALVNAWMRATT